MKLFIPKVISIAATFFLSVWASHGAIDGFAKQLNNAFGNNTYTVPAGKILVVQQLQFGSSAGGTATPANCYLGITSSSSGTAYFPTATNGLYILPKAIFLPSGTIVAYGLSGGVYIFGVLIDTTDMPLFAGTGSGGSSFSNVAVAGDTLTGELKLPNVAGSKVVIESSTDFVNWNYDSSVVIQRSSDKSKVRFSAPISDTSHYYRALVRRSSAG